MIQLLLHFKLFSKERSKNKILNFWLLYCIAENVAYLIMIRFEIMMILSVNVYVISKP